MRSRPATATPGGGLRRLLGRFELLRDTLLGRFAPVRSATRLAVGLRPRRLAELAGWC